jgi:PPM family protein phosphatase
MDSIQFSGNTHTGRRRKENQDAFIMQQLWSADKALLAVIDGVGGYTGGEKAAAIAKDCIEQYMQVPSGDTLTMLREAVIFANNRIVEERKKDQLTSEMCCVLTAVVADTTSPCIYYAHVGDTRLYRYRDGKLKKLTRDHSFVGIREDAGEISEREAMSHPHRNQILREVGSTLHRLDDEDFMDYGRESIEQGDLLLLCSDGLTDMISSQQIARSLSADQPLENKIKDLIELANTSGGHDNITVVLLQPDRIPASVPAKNETSAPEKMKEERSPKANIKRKPEHGNTSFLIGFLLLVVVAGMGWYFAAPKTHLIRTGTPVSLVPARDTMLTDTVSNEPTGRIIHAAVQGPGVQEIADTLYLSATQNFAVIRHYTDSTGKSLVLLPKKNSPHHFAAIAINSPPAKPGDTVVVRNIRLVGFHTGIELHIPVILKTENLVFENTSTPFRYLFKADKNHVSILFMNTPKQ